MMNDAIPLETRFAPPARLPLSEVRLQRDLLQAVPLLDKLLDSLPIAVTMLNGERQIVNANQQFKELIAPNKLGGVIGSRLGEVMDCVRSADMPAGCGTSEHCGVCGISEAILQAQKGTAFQGEGHMTILRGGLPLAVDLRLWAKPLALSGQPFVMLSALDITQENRRKMLEQTFFHDLTNTATAISGHADLIEMFGATHLDDMVEMADFIAEGSHQLIDEIRSHRQLVSAEEGSLRVAVEPLQSAELLRNVINTYRRQPLSEGRMIALAGESEDVRLYGDKALLQRVIGNMVKNALEASAAGDRVTLGASRDEDHVRFWVHNPQYIPRRSQLRIFQRSFSTKGAHRGIGTYSMKLLVEGYMGGSVSFTSSAAAGTTFSAVVPVGGLALA